MSLFSEEVEFVTPLNYDKNLFMQVTICGGILREEILLSMIERDFYGGRRCLKLVESKVGVFLLTILEPLFFKCLKFALELQYAPLTNGLHLEEEV